MYPTMTKERKKRPDKPKIGRPLGQTFPAEDSPIQARLVPEMRKAFKELAARNGVKESEELRAAIREHLIRHKYWPPPAVVVE